MIVEDDAIISLGLRIFLNNQGYEVVDSADFYEKAVQVALDKKPDVILMDIVLKRDKNGIDAATEILKHYHPFIIFCTAYHDREYMDEVHELQCPLLHKPLENFQIIHTIEDFKKQNCSPSTV
ncbi:response regulator [Methanobacterium alcaliphilum]|uniref:response regulator n=1 Tax=Methanobacterium alcaliphilum TaxID=392018 RepID=UPI00200AABDC|nr:response regulator [Methanobacterium alcaliphilum]MCK9151828.1 response regulator [Methanobacterium alcaliphilum]